MYSDEFIVKQVTQQAEKLGASRQRADQAAITCLAAWKRGEFKGKALAMIDKHIKDAVKATKKDQKVEGRLPGV